MKVCDLHIKMPFDNSIWPKSNFKPLILAIVIFFVDVTLKNLKGLRLSEGRNRICRRCDQTNFRWGGGYFAEITKVIENIVWEIGIGSVTCTLRMGVVE